MVPPVQFSAQRRAQLERQCDDLIDRALSTHDEFHASSRLGGWQRVRRRHAMNVYRPRSAEDASGARVLLGSGIVPGTLDDALSGVYCDSTESLRVCKSLLSDKFVDGAVLRVFEAHDLRAPIVFAGIKWFVMRGFAGCSGLLNDKDMLTYERMGRIVDRNGQVFAYHVLQSIDLPGRPANRERGVERVHVSYCYLYRQLSPDWLGVFMLGDVHVSTMIPSSISSFIAAERALSAGNFLRCARAKHFSALMAARKEATEQGAPHCVVCLSPPPKVLGFAHKLCMGCNGQVCRKCRQRRYVFRLQLRSGKPATEYFCRLCVDKVTRYGDAKSSAGVDEVHDVLRAGLRASRSGDSRSKEERSASRSALHESMRLDKLAEFTRRCHDSIAMEKGAITWNQEELLEISQFLEGLSNRSRRRERRVRSGSGNNQLASSQGSRRRHWSGENSSSSATSSNNGHQEDYNGRYDYSDSPTADYFYKEENRHFEEEEVESGPWTECLPNECSGKWAVVFDEDRQEYVRIRVPGADSDVEMLGSSRVKERPQAVCIDELD